MLRRLRIKNLAIIDAVELELGAGLNVLTGETGAGKSILVTALELVLGGKGRADLVRSGASTGEVEAIFEVGADRALSEKLAALLHEGPVDPKQMVGKAVDGKAVDGKPSADAGVGRLAGGVLSVRRVVAVNGRTRAFINGKLVTQQVLGEVAHGLADISSQHEHHTLTDPATHLGYLDAFAGAGALRQRVFRAYHVLLEAQNALRDFEARLRDRAARESLLQAQVREIEDVAPEAGEDTELEQSCVRLRSMDSLLRLTAEAAELLYERDDSVVDGMAQAGRRMAQAAELDPQLSTLSLQLEGLRSQLEDVAREVVRHAGNLRPDPAALQRAEERVHQLSKLKRRYGSNLQAVLAFLEQSRTELDELSDHAATSEALGVSRDRAAADAESAARALSAERHGAAGRLSAAISRELESLGMGEARVHVELTPVGGVATAGSNGAANGGANGAAGGGAGGSPFAHGAAGEAGTADAASVDEARNGSAGLVVDGARLSAEGLERAEFLIAPNRGEEARSLHRVASGGELSRAMLAIKCVLADLGPAGMYAFDEVDAGVGGGMAEIIGRKIRSVAEHRQVLCITHLAQIAVFADQHFKVEKVIRGERTLSIVRRLTEREQREEIARMLGGVKITAKTRAVARELLEQAQSTFTRASAGANRPKAAPNAAHGGAAASPASNGKAAEVLTRGGVVAANGKAASEAAEVSVARGGAAGPDGKAASESAARNGKAAAEGGAAQNGKAAPVGADRGGKAAAESVSRGGAAAANGKAASERVAHAGGAAQNGKATQLGAERSGKVAAESVARGGAAVPNGKAASAGAAHAGGVTQDGKAALAAAAHNGKVAPAATAHGGEAAHGGAMPKNGKPAQAGAPQSGKAPAAAVSGSAVTRSGSGAGHGEGAKAVVTRGRVGRDGVARGGSSLVEAPEGGLPEVRAARGAA